jgi:nucleoside-diphosphate-sugar epimerase
MRRRRILITGSSGRLGSALVQALHPCHDVVQLDTREPNPQQRTIGPVFTGSVTDARVVAQAMKGVDTVIHCAAIPHTRKPYKELLETNVLGTFLVLEEAGNRKEVEQVIYISSLQWHGLSEPPYGHRPLYLPINEDHPSLAVDYYPCSKVQAEYWCERYVQRFGKPVVVVRPPAIVSIERQPGMKAGPLPEYPHLNDYVGTTDLVDGIIRCIEYHPQGGLDRFLLHAADQRSTTPSLDLARRYWPGVPVDREKLSLCEGFGALVDSARAAERLAWKPQYRCRR